MNKSAELIVPNYLSIPTESTNDDNENQDDSYAEDPKEYCIGGYHPIKIGELLNDRYQVISKLGFGTYLTVWQCRDLKKTANVAVEIMKSSAEQSAKNEITCHNYVSKSELFVKLLNNFKVTGINGVHRCLVTELLGGSLLDLIVETKAGLPIQNVKIIAKQLLEGLDYLHVKCKIIHADIKPDNILFCMEDRLKVKIADYGFVRSAKRHSDEQIQAIEYRCPEVILVCEYGTSADILSLGCVLFQLATREFLFSPAAGDGYCLAEHHLALMMQMLGRIPKRMMLKGRKGVDFFTENGTLRNVPPLESYNLFRRQRRDNHLDRKSAAEFWDFLLPMFKFNPYRRASGNQCLRHEWLN